MTDTELDALVRNLRVQHDGGDEAADALTRLSHALAAETAKREAMEVALYGLAKACEGEPSEVFEGEIGAALTHAHATLAKHGSKT